MRLYRRYAPTTSRAPHLAVRIDYRRPAVQILVPRAPHLARLFCVSAPAPVRVSCAIAGIPVCVVAVPDCVGVTLRPDDGRFIGDVCVADVI
jgi:hypothetical protein